MSESVLTALISGGITLIGTILTIILTSKKSEEKQNVKLAVMDSRLTDLTREVREQNDFARRVPVIEEQIRVVNHRIKDLEGSKNV